MTTSTLPTWNYTEFSIDELLKVSDKLRKERELVDKQMIEAIKQVVFKYAYYTQQEWADKFNLTLLELRDILYDEHPTISASVYDRIKAFCDTLRK